MGMPPTANRRIAIMPVDAAAARILLPTPTQKSDAFGQEGKNALPGCNGRHPHLRSYDRDQCHEQWRAILLGASNSWFSIALCTLAVQNPLETLVQLFEKHANILGITTTQQKSELLAPM